MSHGFGAPQSNIEWRSPSGRVEKMEGRYSQDINALGAQHIRGRSFSADGFLNEIYFIFSLTITLGRVANNLTLVSI